MGIGSNGCLIYGCFLNGGTPKWMVDMENPMKMDDLGVPPFKETPTQTPPKTSMTMKKTPRNEDVFPIKIMIVLFHASFQGCKLACDVSLPGCQLENEGF